MTIGTSNQTKLSFIKEVTPGVTPATPALKLLRFTGESLQATNTTTTSEEIRDDRATSDLVLTDQSVGGDINTEVSGQELDEFLEAAMFTDSPWTTNTDSGATFEADATGFLDSGNGFIANGALEVGQFINISGFTDTTIDGYYRILTLSAGEITTYPAPTAIEAAGASVTYVGSTIKSGKTDHSYTIQKSFEDVTTETYINFRGCRVSTMSQTLAVGSLAVMTFGFLGESSEVTESAIAGQTETPKTTNAIMNCVGDVTDITAVGSGITSAFNFTDLALSYDNALRELKAIGTLGSIDIRAGTIVANSTINPYFESKELLDAFLANSSFVLSWQIVASDGYGYIFSLPNVKFTSQDLAAGAKDEDLIINGEVQGILDPSSATTMRIDRFTP